MASRVRCQVVVGLGVDHQHICSGFRKGRQMARGVFHHEVHVKKKPAQGAQGLDERGTKGNVGHKGPVHDVQVQPGKTGGFQRGQFLGQTAKSADNREGERIMPWLSALCGLRAAPASYCPLSRRRRDNSWRLSHA